MFFVLFLYVCCMFFVCFLHVFCMFSVCFLYVFCIVFGAMLDQFGAMLDHLEAILSHLGAMLSHSDKSIENRRKLSPLGDPPHRPTISDPGARIGDNVLIGLKITNRNFNQLEAAFRHPAKTVPRGVQIPSQLALYFRCLFYRFWEPLGSIFDRFWAPF